MSMRFDTEGKIYRKEFEGKNLVEIITVINPPENQQI